jgi:hypothetical protein
MKKNSNLIFLFLILLIIVILLLIYKFVYGYKDNFAFGVKDMGEYDANLDGQQEFPYIVNPTYDNTIKTTYYLNDDTKVDNIRIVNHKYQIKSGPYYGSTTPTKPSTTIKAA